ncbi:OmpH family outer membrane protein [Thermodesulfobacteriota bacterium]
MKLLFRFFFIMIVIFMFQHSAFAADAIKIGILDLQRCMQESNEGKRVFQSLKKKHDSMQKKLDERQNELIQMQKEIEKQSLMLSLDAKEDKRKEFERRRRDLGYILQDLNEEMNKSEASARKKILKDLEGIVEKIALKGAYDLIIERRGGGILFTSEGLHITDQVIDAYNKEKP